MSDEIYKGIPEEKWKQMGANWNDDRMYEMGRRDQEREIELQALKSAQIDQERKHETEVREHHAKALRLLREDRELREKELRDSESEDDRLAREEKQREEFLEMLERQRDWPSKAEEEGLHGE